MGYDRIGYDNNKVIIKRLAGPTRINTNATKDRVNKHYVRQFILKSLVEYREMPDQIRIIYSRIFAAVSCFGTIKNWIFDNFTVIFIRNVSRS
jgi:hypothetical protein